MAVQPLDAVQLLEREHEHLRGLDGGTFLRRLPAYVNAVSTETRFADALAEMEREAYDALREYGASIEALVAETAAIRHQLVEREATVDDSTAVEPEDFGSHAYSEYMFTLAYFDRLEQRDVHLAYPKLPSDTVQEDPVPELVNILRGKIHTLRHPGPPDPFGDREDQRPDLRDLALELSNIQMKHSHAVRVFDNASKTLAGIAFARLQLFAESLNAEPILFDPHESIAERANRLLGMTWTPESVIQSALRGGEHDTYTKQRFAVIVGDLKAQEALFFTELVPRFARAERERERRFSRRASRWVARNLGTPLVQGGAVAVATFVVGLIIGLLLDGGDDTANTPTVTVTTSR